MEIELILALWMAVFRSCYCQSPLVADKLKCFNVQIEARLSSRRKIFKAFNPENEMLKLYDGFPDNAYTGFIHYHHTHNEDKTHFKAMQRVIILNCEGNLTSLAEYHIAGNLTTRLSTPLKVLDAYRCMEKQDVCTDDMLTSINQASNVDKVSVISEFSKNSESSDYKSPKDTAAPQELESAASDISREQIGNQQETENVQETEAQEEVGNEQTEAQADPEKSEETRVYAETEDVEQTKTQEETEIFEDVDSRGTEESELKILDSSLQ